jgi:hypothetical protein
LAFTDAALTKGTQTRTVVPVLFGVARWPPLAVLASLPTMQAKQTTVIKLIDNYPVMMSLFRVVVGWSLRIIPVP